MPLEIQSTPILQKYAFGVFPQTRKRSNYDIPEWLLMYFWHSETLGRTWLSTQGRGKFTQHLKRATEFCSQVSQSTEKTAKAKSHSVTLNFYSPFKSPFSPPFSHSKLAFRELSVIVIKCVFTFQAFLSIISTLWIRHLAQKVPQTISSLICSSLCVFLPSKLIKNVFF